MSNTKSCSVHSSITYPCSSILIRKRKGGSSESPWKVAQYSLARCRCETMKIIYLNSGPNYGMVSSITRFCTCRPSSSVFRSLPLYLCYIGLSSRASGEEFNPIFGNARGCCWYLQRRGQRRDLTRHHRIPYSSSHIHGDPIDEHENP